jgi:hypothetical protein
MDTFRRLCLFTLDIACDFGPLVYIMHKLFCDMDNRFCPFGRAFAAENFVHRTSRVHYAILGLVHFGIVYPARPFYTPVYKYTVKNMRHKASFRTKKTQPIPAALILYLTP